jgi:hypothetical protein
MHTQSDRLASSSKVSLPIISFPDMGPERLILCLLPYLTFSVHHSLDMRLFQLPLFSFPFLLLRLPLCLLPFLIFSVHHSLDMRLSRLS